MKIKFSAVNLLSWSWVKGGSEGDGYIAKKHAFNIKNTENTFVQVFPPSFVLDISRNEQTSIEKKAISNFVEDQKGTIKVSIALN